MTTQQILERNTRGDLLCNVDDLAKAAAADRFSRYNGGWVKTVRCIDKDKTNGYSLVGEFVDGTTWLRPGLYLDCSISGSRKHHRKSYTLFALTSAGQVEILATQEDTRDWAVRLWPAVDWYLAQSEDLGSQRQALQAERAQLVARLAKIDEQIKNLR